ncbi:hypothetical protein PoMZ_01864 [Pyricularia oryzae]|uniref:Pseudouridine synthase RsuA/RluA-like domain-containing protein n=1 Tax=Pyricularia oryzae TaxID=318829 RepID=A0A4P7N7M5_PYROR|nr:hypothetical protein PoMZ_01864 [Pyricularia oryzae]
MASVASASAAAAATAATPVVSTASGESTTPKIPQKSSKQRKKQPSKEDHALPSDPEVIWPPPYVIEDGLRRVEPYHFAYRTWVKERWRGRALVDVFESEFRDRPIEYYRECMEKGSVLVNAKKVGPNHILKNGELIAHICHRHEPPCTADPVQVLHEDDEMIVINKPSGMPVHPAGRYNFNSVVEVMRSERSRDFKAYPCNRLDRLTSGIMFIAKTPQAACKMGEQIMGRTVRKEYLARVIGRFPDGEVICNEPILQISPKLGLNRVRANGRHARTVFKRLAYYPPAEGQGNEAKPGEAANGRPWRNKQGYSIVRCLPVTGRTHQIRVHLQHLGHPIENDPIYANYKVWGLNLGANDGDASLNSDEDIISRLSRMGKEDVAEAVAYYDEMVDEYYKKKAEKMSGELCKECDTPLYTDPGSHELSLWLHSLRYEDSGGAWSYSSPMPKWALPPDGMNGPVEVGDMKELVVAVRDTNPELVSADILEVQMGPRFDDLQIGYSRHGDLLYFWGCGRLAIFGHPPTETWTLGG